MRGMPKSLFYRHTPLKLVMDGKYYFRSRRRYIDRMVISSMAIAL